MSPSTKRLLEQVESWPAEDQEELAEYAREIEARRASDAVATARHVLNNAVAAVIASDPAKIAAVASPTPTVTRKVVMSSFARWAEVTNTKWLSQ